MMYEKILKHFIEPRDSRILLDIAKHKRLTVSGLCERNPSIPRSTMYRILTRMERDGLVEIVDYRQKRGTVEKTYALVPEILEGPSIEEGDITNELLADMFLKYCMDFAMQFRDYAERNPGKADQMEPRGFWVAPVYATDREMLRLTEEFGRIMSQFVSRDAEGERKLHSVGLIIAPSSQSSDHSEE